MAYYDTHPCEAALGEWRRVQTVGRCGQAIRALGTCRDKAART